MTRRTKKRIYNITVGILLISALMWVCAKFIHFGKVEFTENAQVKQLIVPVSSRVQGFVKQINFDEYDVVTKGDTLMIIDDAEFRFQLAQAEANYQDAITGKSVMHDVVNTAHNNVSVTDSGIEEARLQMENAERNFRRYENLISLNAVTQQQYDDSKTAYQAAKARHDMMLRQRASATSVTNEQSSRIKQSEARIKLAEAAVDLARLNLSYTVITAPCSGVLGRREIQAGQLVNGGQVIVEIVDNDDKWVVANFKETQMSNIREGMDVEIEVDAVPNVKFTGVVRSISGATGACFSLLPQDNSSGNFVKIEQRIPVRIDFTSDNASDDLSRVRSGMNVECTVNY